MSACSRHRVLGEIGCAQCERDGLYAQLAELEMQLKQCGHERLKEGFREADLEAALRSLTQIIRAHFYLTECYEYRTAVEEAERLLATKDEL